MAGYRANYGEGALDEDDQESMFSYNYVDDLPDAIMVIGGAVLGGRPVNRGMGPAHLVKILATASEYRAATPRRAGKGKPLPASANEKEMEVKSRKDAQKACRRLILPKAKAESSDAFIRRLDAHRHAPEAMIPPLSPPETDLLFAKRMVAVKANENPDIIILPKSTRESDAEFDERLALAKGSACVLIFPHGAHESGGQCKARMQNQARTRRTIMPKAAEESDVLFADRCKAQAACEQVIHPYDSKRENQHQYARRLEAHKSKTALAFEPGDTAAVDRAIGPEKSEHKVPNALKKAIVQVGAHPTRHAIRQRELA